jgi:hypothetical protein
MRRRRELEAPVFVGSLRTFDSLMTGVWTQRCSSHCFQSQSHPVPILEIEGLRSSYGMTGKEPSHDERRRESERIYDLEQH